MDKAIAGVRTGVLDTEIPKRVNPVAYLVTPKREQGNYTSAALQSLANINEILNKVPAWKMKKNNPDQQEEVTA